MVATPDSPDRRLLSVTAATAAIRPLPDLPVPSPSMAGEASRGYHRSMRPIPLKARDRLLFGAAMAGTALVWVVAPDVKLTSFGFLASGATILASAGYAWWKRDS